MSNLWSPGKKDHSLTNCQVVAGDCWISLDETVCKEGVTKKDFLKLLRVRERVYWPIYWQSICCQSKSCALLQKPTKGAALKENGLHFHFHYCLAKSWQLGVFHASNQSNCKEDFGSAPGTFLWLISPVNIAESNLVKPWALHITFRVHMNLPCISYMLKILFQFLKKLTVTVNTFEYDIPTRSRLSWRVTILRNCKYKLSNTVTKWTGVFFCCCFVFTDSDQ